MADFGRDPRSSDSLRGSRNFLSGGQRSRSWSRSQQSVEVASWISLDHCSGPNSHEGRTASPCQISSKSVEPRPRYGDFSIFQDGGRRHLGFEILNF